MEQPHTLSFRRRNLPHWSVEDRPYFVTFRLKGTLPQAMVKAYHDALSQAESIGVVPDELLKIHRQQFLRMEKILDVPAPAVAHLRDPRVAQLVMDGFDWLERERGWNVLAGVVMPNHVHCCLVNERDRSSSLSEDIGSVKKFTARQANRLLGRDGQFWQSENFDRWCRTVTEVEKVIRYIQENPVKARLAGRAEEWPWQW